MGKGHFFAGPPKHHGVSTFQADNLSSEHGRVTDQFVDAFLGGALFSCAFAHAHDLTLRFGVKQNVLMDQAVMEDDVGLLQRLDSLQRQQVRVTGPCADQPQMCLIVGME